MPHEVKPRRADALRNEEKILQVAISQFARHGVEASMDGIAKEAGVGSGTLYRHFPTRDYLIASALRACTVELHALRESLTDSEDDLSALREWLRLVRDYVRTFHGLSISVLHAVNDKTSPLSRACVEMQSITAHFLHRAQEAGTARRNVTAKDLLVAQLALVCADDIASGENPGSESLEQLLAEGYAAHAPGPDLKASPQQD